LYLRRYGCPSKKPNGGPFNRFRAGKPSVAPGWELLAVARPDKTGRRLAVVVLVLDGATLAMVLL
jgi:hypothetical protein